MLNVNDFQTDKKSVNVCQQIEIPCLLNPLSMKIHKLPDLVTPFRRIGI